MRILFKFPTRGRPVQFLKTLHYWLVLMSGKHDCDFVIAIDTDDETMNRPVIYDTVQQFEDYSPRSRIGIECKDYSGCVEAVNYGLGKMEWDIVMSVSDDLIPTIANYDERVVNDMRQCFPNNDGVIYYADGRRKANILTHPIMGRALFDQRDTFLNPAYRFGGADRDLHLEMKHSKRLRFVKGIVLFKHEHEKYGRDATHARSRQIREDEGKKVKILGRNKYYGKFDPVEVL